MFAGICDFALCFDWVVDYVLIVLLILVWIVDWLCLVVILSVCFADFGLLCFGNCVCFADEFVGWDCCLFVLILIACCF